MECKSREELLRYSMSEYLSMYPWGYFLTQTFRNQTKSVKVAKQNFYYFLHEVRRQGKAKSASFMLAVEYHKSGFLHNHALIESIEGVDCPMMWRISKEMYGRASVYEYEPEKGANYYITKYMLKSYMDYELYLRKKGNIHIKEPGMYLKKQGGEFLSLT